MGLGVVLGGMVSPVVIAIIWLLVFSPVALAFRLLRRDALKIRNGAERASSWEAHEAPAEVKRYFRQF
jgi:hypothetical protein